MKLIRFKCDEEECRKDFYVQWEDLGDIEPGGPLCPFCDPGSPVQIDEVQFDDKSVIEQDLIDEAVIKFRDLMQGLEEVLCKIENIKAVMEEGNG